MVWIYFGVWLFYNDGVSLVMVVMWDYVFSFDVVGVLLLNVFGGKIIIYCWLVESVLVKFVLYFLKVGVVWMVGVVLLGGDFLVDGVGVLVDDLCVCYLCLFVCDVLWLVCIYGIEVVLILFDLFGYDFGVGLIEVELCWFVICEFVICVEDVLWCRMKLGLRMDGV